MPALGATLQDEDIADALTYIRREWEHNGTPVTPAQVKKVLEATQEHPDAWTAKELQGVK